jgi:hypothetical protein
MCSLVGMVASDLVKPELTIKDGVVESIDGDF